MIRWIMGVGLALALAPAALAQAPAPTAKIEHGRQVYDYWCATCHGAGIGNNGAKNLPGTAALLAKYKGEKPALLSERTDLTSELVSFYVRNGITIMPFFRKTEVSDPDLDAIGAYLTRSNR